MLCAKVLRVPQRHGRLYRALEDGFNRLASGYARTLRLALHHRLLVVGIAFLTTLSAVVVFRTLKRDGLNLPAEFAATVNAAVINSTIG